MISTPNVPAIVTGKINVPLDGPYFHNPIDVNEREHPSGLQRGFAYTALAAVDTAVAEDIDTDPVRLIVGFAFPSFGLAVSCDPDGAPVSDAQPQLLAYTSVSKEEAVVIEDDSFCGADVEDRDVFTFTAYVRLLDEPFLRDPATAEIRFLLVDLATGLPVSEGPSPS